MVILGVEKDENLYVKQPGSWDARYVPAFVRRYPFVFSRSDDGQTFTLCIDETWSGCNADGKGERPLLGRPRVVNVDTCCKIKLEQVDLVAHDIARKSGIIE